MLGVNVLNEASKIHFTKFIGIFTYEKKLLFPDQGPYEQHVSSTCVSPGGTRV